MSFVIPCISFPKHDAITQALKSASNQLNSEFTDSRIIYAVAKTFASAIYTNTIDIQTKLLITIIESDPSLGASPRLFENIAVYYTTLYNSGVLAELKNTAK